MKKFLFILLLSISSFTLAGCTAATNQNTDNRNTESTGSVNNISDQSITVDFDIEAAHLVYSPNVIEAQAGSTITVRVTSVDEVHDFVIDELNVDSGLLGAGRSTILTIQIPQDASGKTFEFYCSVGSHRAMGMVGSLVVR